MKFRRLVLVFLFVAGAIGCRVFPEVPGLYNEDIVLRVWDALDAHYGSEIFFECEYLTVLDGRIEIVRPYPVSDIAVVAYALRANEIRFFRPVRSDPGESEFVVEGTTLRFNSRYENQTLFVAWIPDLSGVQHSE